MIMCSHVKMTALLFSKKDTLDDFFCSADFSLSSIESIPSNSAKLLIRGNLTVGMVNLFIVRVIVTAF